MNELSHLVLLRFLDLPVLLFRLSEYVVCICRYDVSNMVCGAMIARSHVLRPARTPTPTLSAASPIQKQNNADAQKCKNYSNSVIQNVAGEESNASRQDR